MCCSIMTERKNRCFAILTRKVYIMLATEVKRGGSNMKYDIYVKNGLFNLMNRSECIENMYGVLSEEYFIPWHNINYIVRHD